MLAATLFVGSNSSFLQAQDDDDTIFIEPSWARNVMEQEDFDASFRELNKLDKAHTGSYVIPYLRARIWGLKADEAEADSERIEALKQENRFWVQAKSLATGPQNAKLRAEIDVDIRDSVNSLRALNAAPWTGPGATTAKSKPDVITKPKAVQKPRHISKPVLAAPTATKPVRAVAVVKLPPLKPRPGYVIGRAIFPDGRPIPNFSVNVLGYDGQVNLGGGSTPTLGWGDGKNGRYAIRTFDTFLHKKPVAGLVTSVQLKAKLNYQGQVYTMYLHPIDNLRDGGGKGQFKGNSGPGVVRDFVLKISGVKPQWANYDLDENNGPNDASTFYGAQLTLNLTGTDGNTQPLNATVPKGSQLFVTLVPKGNLLDGSKGQTQVRKVNIGATAYYFYLRNIPIGAYSVTAQLKTPTGEVWPLRSNTSSENFKSSTQVLFGPYGYESSGSAATQTLHLVR